MNKLLQWLLVLQEGQEKKNRQMEELNRHMEELNRFTDQAREDAERAANNTCIF